MISYSCQMFLFSGLLLKLLAQIVYNNQSSSSIKIKKAKHEVNKYLKYPNTNGY